MVGHEIRQVPSKGQRVKLRYSSPRQHSRISQTSHELTSLPNLCLSAQPEEHFWVPYHRCSRSRRIHAVEQSPASQTTEMTLRQITAIHLATERGALSSHGERGITLAASKFVALPQTAQKVI